MTTLLLIIATAFAQEQEQQVVKPFVYNEGDYTNSSFMNNTAF